LLRDIHLRDRDRRRESQFAGEEHGLRDAVRHDHGVDLLRDVGRHLASGRPSFHEGLRIAFPEDVSLDLDKADNRFGSVIVRREAEVDRGMLVTKFRDECDRAIVIDT